MSISEFVKDSEGRLSSMRLSFLVWTIGVFITWVYASISHKTLQPIDNSIVVMIGAITSGKVIQSFGEKNQDSISKTPLDKIIPK